MTNLGRPQKQQKIRKCHKTANVWHVFFLGGGLGRAGYCSQSTFCSVSPCPHVFLRRVGSLNLSPHLWENFSPNFGKTPNFSPISETNSSPKLVNPQICPQILGQIRPQIWWIPKLVPNFRDKFVPKFGDSPNLSSNFRKIFSPNLVNPQICPQISGQIRPQICPQKAREHTSITLKDP